MTTPSIGKDETWSVLFEDRGDGVFKNFLFDIYIVLMKTETNSFKTKTQSTKRILQ